MAEEDCEHIEEVVRQYGEAEVHICQVCKGRFCKRCYFDLGHNMKCPKEAN